MKSILISNIKDIDNFDLNKFQKIYKTDYLIDQFSKLKLIPLIENNNNNNGLKIVNELANNWYRNHKGEDYISNEEYSILPSLHRKIAVYFANILRFYFPIKEKLERGEEFYISVNAPKPIKRIDSVLKNLRKYDSPYKYDDIITSSPDVAKIDNLNVHGLSGIAKKFKSF